MPVGTVGSKSMVYRGSAHKTSGGLTKKDLMVNKRGRIVSRKAHAAGKVAFKRNGLKAKTAAQMAEMRKR